MQSFTYNCLSPTVEPFSFSMATFEDSSDSNWTKPYPLLFPSSDMTTLLDRILPYFLNISCSPALSIDSGKFCQATRKKNFVRNPFKNQQRTKQCPNYFESKLSLNSRYLNKQVPYSIFPRIRIATRPHHPHRFPIQRGVIFQLDCTNCYNNNHHFIINKISTLRSLSTFIS